jgi:magnesium transporter
MRARRDSRAAIQDLGASWRQSYSRHGDSRETRGYNPISNRRSSAPDSDGDSLPGDSRTPLLGGRREPGQVNYGLFKPHKNNKQRGARRSGSAETSRSSIFRRPFIERGNSSLLTPHPEYDVNNPPSVPPSPKLGAHENNLDDLMLNNGFMPGSPTDRRPGSGDQLIDIDGDADATVYPGRETPSTPRLIDQRRHTLPFTTAEEDVCFPVEGMSELAEEDYLSAAQTGQSRDRPRRKRARQWPDLAVLEEWSRDEKEERSEIRRAKRISEPVLVGGRLRAHKNHWHREEEDAPYRFTYFNEELESTIHSQTISELLQPGQTFRELFIPDPPELDSSSDEEDDDAVPPVSILSPSAQSRAGTRQSSILGDGPSSAKQSRDTTPPNFNPQTRSQIPPEKPRKYGPRPTFWLDVLSPTEAEMKIIQRAFGIHPLTAEDILMQEAREKVELFRNYYFVNYRTFEQDYTSSEYLEPVNFYIVVFREGVITFHFSMTPHPANVRRRIRQLKDYLVLTADWISYALIDDITDVFQPLNQSIEDEVDEIDDKIMQMHMRTDPEKDEKLANKDPEKRSNASGTMTAGSQGDMLLRVGQVRKKVMGLYRLLGNKADVIKGFAKRCNEQWEVAPRSEIGLYLGDIQDHILTMTSNLNHYET